MAQPKLPRCRRKLPPAAPRTMDMLGIGKDGHLYLWSAAQQVQPVSTFESGECGIVSGHYLVEHKGHAVAVHCGNLTDGRVSVQFMCGGLRNWYLPRKDVEAILLGRVMPDPVKDAEILQMLRDLNKTIDAQQTAPHRRRGKL